MINQVFRSLLDRFNSFNRAVSPDFHHQAFVIGDLADPGALNVVVDFPHGAEHRVHRQDTDWWVRCSVGLDRRFVTHSLFNIELDGQMGII